MGNMRRVFAEIYVNDDEAINCGYGTLDYLDVVISSASLSSIEVGDTRIANDDEDDKFEEYINYVAEWAICGSHGDGGSPMIYPEWLASKIAEYLTNYGALHTTNGNYHIGFNEVNRLFGTSIPRDPMLDYIAESFDYDVVAHACMDEDFDLTFYTKYCPLCEDD